MNKTRQSISTALIIGCQYPDYTNIIIDATCLASVITHWFRVGEREKVSFLPWPIFIDDDVIVFNGRAEPNTVPIQYSIILYFPVFSCTVYPFHSIPFHWRRVSLLFFQMANQFFNDKTCGEAAKNGQDE